MKTCTLDCKNFELFVCDWEGPNKRFKLNGLNKMLCSYHPTVIIDGEKYHINNFWSDARGVEYISHKEAFHRYGKWLKEMQNYNPETMTGEIKIDDASINCSFAVPLKPSVPEFINISVKRDNYLNFLDYRIEQLEEEYSCACIEISDLLQAKDFDEADRKMLAIKSMHDNIIELATERESVAKAINETK